jgi:hypothetical protein
MVLRDFKIHLFGPSHEQRERTLDVPRADMKKNAAAVSESTSSSRQAGGGGSLLGLGPAADRSGPVKPAIAAKGQNPPPWRMK